MGYQCYGLFSGNRYYRFTSRDDSVSPMEVAKKRKRYLCPHCALYLTKSAYYCHKERFYNPVTKEWKIDVAELCDTTSDTTDSGEDSGLKATRLNKVSCKSWHSGRR